ncbi:MAG: type II CRISPR-associated endonuclease Cas1 [Verrucomicrobiales bacterium]|nr:type II CRISPR-associated endonuclease Cas1 [Verrucomicrobiales bacterium]
MSYHVIHILTHGATLAKERGMLVCCPPKDDPATPERRLPLEDIRAVVIAARGVTLTSSAISGILGHDGMLLHCDESYRPVGITAPMPRIIDTRAFLTQASQPKRLNDRLWQKLLLGKTANQQAVLRQRDLFSAHLERAMKQKQIDEGNCARHYWQLYFPSIGWSATRRDRKLNTPPNRMLNYGYTVLSALCHRSLIVHGLSPLLGVGHVARYRSDPLVYDVMEPYRPFVDCLLADFMCQSQEITEAAWCRHIGRELRERRVEREPYSLKLLDAIDKTASSLAQSYSHSSPEPLWVPALN